MELTQGKTITCKEQKLTHLVYEAALDNSLWPELIIELTEFLEQALKSLPDHTGGSININENIITHLKRAFSISQQIIANKEQLQTMQQVLDCFSFGIALFDSNATVLVENQSIKKLNYLNHKISTNQLTTDSSDNVSIKRCIAIANNNDTPTSLLFKKNDTDIAFLGLLLPKKQAFEIGFPTMVHSVLLVIHPSLSTAIQQLVIEYDLTPREKDLLDQLALGHNLKQSAHLLEISYESARTYLKNIFNKTDISRQVDLIRRLSFCPSTLLKDKPIGKTNTPNVRQTMIDKHGLQTEYFQLGKKNSYPIIYCDALAGSALDLTGTPNTYLPHLCELDIQMISVCRPGTFQSAFVQYKSLRDYAKQIIEITEHLDLKRFSLFSYSYGAASALGIANELKHRIDRIIMSAPCYPKYIPSNWREMDLFCQLTNVVGQKWPNMFRQLLPFLVRSVLQNIDRYCDRNIKRSNCPDDIRVLKSEQMRTRSAELLKQRTFNSIQGLIQENILNIQGWDFSLANVDIPVTIVHGELDNVSPKAAAKLLARQLPDVKLYILKEKGHYHLFDEWKWLFKLCSGVSFEDISDSPIYYRDH